MTESGAPRDAAAMLLFRTPDLDWHPVSPRLALERRIPLVLLAMLAAAALAVSAAADAPLDAVLLVAGVVGFVAPVVGWFLVGRQVSAWGYAEREQDLLVTRGRLYRRLTVIPYGRMQVIEVQSGPISGWLGIATVILVTASASTDAQIPGLPVEEAHALRDRLAAKGEATTAGL